jgi:integrase
VVGLVLRVADTGRKTWVVRYRTPDGRQPRLTLGTYPALGLGEARDFAGEAIKAASKGADPSAEKRRARNTAKEQPLKTVDDLAAAYFADCRSGDYRARRRQKAESTIIGEEGLYKRHLHPSIGDDRLEDVAPDGLKRLVRAIAKKSGIQANRSHSLLSQLFNYAVKERQRLPANPLAGVKKPVEETPRDRVLTDQELRAIWIGLNDPASLTMVENGEKRPVYIGRPVAIAIRLLALLLQRRSEISGMALGELDLDQKVWVIAKERTKNRREHVVPLPDEAVTLIREAITLAEEAVQRARLRAGASGDPGLLRPAVVFPSPRDVNKPIGGGALTHAFNDLCTGSSLENAHIHDLRRTGSTNLTSERGGQRRFVVSKVLNHSDNEGAAVTGVYDRNEYAVEKRRALARWEEILMEIVRDSTKTGNVSPMRSAES